jgi:hypothetical protein
MNMIIVFAIILFVITIFIINKQLNLEGYTFIPNMGFPKNRSNIPILNKTNVLKSTCDSECNKFDRNVKNIGCSGYSSDIPNNTKKRGVCNFYSKGILNANQIDNMRITPGINLYIK